MNLTLDPLQFSETLEGMERLIKFYKYSECRHSEIIETNLFECLFDSQMMAKGFRELLLICKPTGQLSEDEYFHLLAQVDDFLIFVHGEIRSVEKLTAS